MNNHFIRVLESKYAYISTYIVLEGWDAGWGRHYSWICQNVEAGTEQGSTAMKPLQLQRLFYSSFCCFESNT